MSIETHKLNLKIERLEETLRLVIGELAHDEVLSLAFVEKLREATFTNSDIDKEADKRDDRDFWREEAAKAQLRSMVP